jgi:putative tricarboxylic transport membrane protein
MKGFVRGIRIIVLSILAIALGTLAAGVSGAASFVPSKPIELVTFSDPGSGVGLFGELVGSIMEKEHIIPVPMPRVYKPGGGQAIGMAYVAEKKGNPYCLGTSSNPVVVTPIIVGATKKTITHRDLAHIAIIAFDETGILVKYDSPYKTLKDLITAAKSSPPKSIKWGGTSVGSNGNMLSASLAKAAGIQFNYIPFPGGGEANVALLGGHVDVIAGQPSEIMTHIEGKTMRMLALATEERVSGSMLKDVPTLKELGYNNLIFRTFRGICAPLGLSAEAMAYYQDAVKKVTQTAAFKKYLADNNMTGTFMDSAQATKFTNDLVERVTPILIDVGVIKK